ncbi:MAG TPA: hypothetical protein VFT45_26070 [Longimicrobium sp.]|nr:hypothetical protein [Longimicrobium sp.]
MANDADLSDARRFISEHLSSAEQLDVLLLLHAEPGGSFSAVDVSERVYTVPAAALLRMDELARAGLLMTDGAADPRYRYAPASPALAERVDTLARAYRADRVGVVRMIYDKPKDDPVRSFADAFRLRRPGG